MSKRKSQNCRKIAMIVGKYQKKRKTEKRRKIVEKSWKIVGKS